MNVSEEIINVLEYLGEQFGITINWGSETVLPVLKQLFEKYIAWEIMTSTIWIVVGGLLLGGGIYFTVLSFKEGKVNNWGGLQFRSMDFRFIIWWICSAPWNDNSYVSNF